MGRCPGIPLSEGRCLGVPLSERRCLGVPYKREMSPNSCETFPSFREEMPRSPLQKGNVTQFLRNVPPTFLGVSSKGGCGETSPVIAQSVLAQSPRQVREIGVTNKISYHCHLNRKSPLFRDRQGLPQGRRPR
jgi:hypothetical protein